MFTLIGTAWRKLRNRALATFFRWRGIELGVDSQLDAHVRLQRGIAQGRAGRISSGPHLRCGQGVILNAHGGSIALGSRVYLGPYSVIYGHGGVTVGDNCLIAMHCCILSSEHTVAPLGMQINSQPDVLLPTNIGADVWLGARVTVLGGVTIGDGCVIGAGSVVTKDLPPGSVAVGVPARVIRQRQ
jgi:acetyltransferase-like isoleucine patch superfamily enzyme